jgi:hypothetical protein
MDPNLQRLADAFKNSVNANPTLRTQASETLVQVRFSLIFGTICGDRELLRASFRYSSRLIHLAQ